MAFDPAAFDLVASRASTQSIAGEKLLEQELASQRRRAAAWQRRAEAAVEAGDDDLARRALARRREHDSLVRALEEQLAGTRAANARLRRQIDALHARRAEAGRKLATLAARQTATRARGQIDTGGAMDAFARFEQLSKRVELAEAEADALEQLEYRDDAWLASLEAIDESRAIEAELAALQARRPRPG